MIGQELAQAVVLLRVGTGDDADEGTPAVAILGQRQGGLDEGRQNRFQLAGALFQGGPELAQPLAAHLVHPAPEHLVDQVFLGSEVVIDRRDVDVRPAGDLAQGGARETVLGEQLLGRAQDAFLGGEVRGIAHAWSLLNQTLV